METDWCSKRKDHFEGKDGGGENEAESKGGGDGEQAQKKEDDGIELAEVLSRVRWANNSEVDGGA